MEIQPTYQFACGQDAAVYVRVREYKDRKYVDFRVFFPLKETGEMHPTRKGITLSAELLGELKKGIAACEKELQEPIR